MNNFKRKTEEKVILKFSKKNKKIQNSFQNGTKWLRISPLKHPKRGSSQNLIRHLKSVNCKKNANLIFFYAQKKLK